MLFFASFASFLLRTLQTIDLICKDLNKNRKGVFVQISKKKKSESSSFLGGDAQSYSIIIRLEVSKFSFLGRINVKTPSSNLA